MNDDDLASLYELCMKISKESGDEIDWMVSFHSKPPPHDNYLGETILCMKGDKKIAMIWDSNKHMKTNPFGKSNDIGDRKWDED